MVLSGECVFKALFVANAIIADASRRASPPTTMSEMLPVGGAGAGGGAGVGGGVGGVTIGEQLHLGSCGGSPVCLFPMGIERDDVTAERKARCRHFRARKNHNHGNTMNTVAGGIFLVVVTWVLVRIR